jgi:hypothetical protein
MRRLLFITSIAAIAALVTVPSFAGAASSTAWKVYNYNSSGHSITPTSATSTSADNASFDFQQNVYTAQLVTTAKTLVGNLTDETVNATVTVSGVTGTFVDQNGGGCTPDNQTVRLFFTTKNPGFNYTDYWWSNPVSYQLTGNGTMTMSVSLADPSQWSDWNGQKGDSSASVTDAFNAAVANVQTIGLSFGGGCFFENGVTTSDGSGTFALTGFSD